MDRLPFQACSAAFQSPGVVAISRECHSQVSVLSHEDASVTEQLPYMASRCAPVQVLEFFGRAAKRRPPRKPHECVFNWWKDRCDFQLPHPNAFRSYLITY